MISKKLVLFDHALYLEPVFYSFNWWSCYGVTLQGAFVEYEKESYEKLTKSIEAHPTKEVQAVLKSFLAKIYKRQKWELQKMEANWTE